jgi:MraZ protein
VFLGTHTPRLDEKGRLILPAKFRDQLAEGVVITKGQERCLFVFTAAAFAAKAACQEEPTTKAARDYRRIFFASAFDEVPRPHRAGDVPAGLRRTPG